jgi:NADPH2:quinone reductase
MKHKRIVVTHYGGPDALQVVEEEWPEPKAGEVRVRVLAAGVALPDIMAREGVHPETPRVPFTPGWDLVGTVERLGDGVLRIEPGQIVAAMPVSGAYAEFICLPQRDLVPVPSGLDAAEAVSLVLNYITAYQMMHRSAKVKPGQRVLIHGASGGVGTALLQLGRLAGLEMYGTCSARGASTVSNLGAIPIDYQHQDFVKEIHRLTHEGVDAVFDPIGGAHLWHSRQALRAGGSVVGYCNTSALRGEGLTSGRSGGRNRFHGIPIFALYIIGGWLVPGPETGGPLQHPVAHAPETGMVSAGFDRPVRPPATAEDQTAHCAAISSGGGQTGAGVARKGRGDREDRVGVRGRKSRARRPKIGDAA